MVASTASFGMRSATRETLAKLDAGLSGFDHPASEHNLLWNAADALRARDLVRFVDDPIKRRLAETTFDAYDGAIAFRWKDYRVSGPERRKTMRLHPHEFIRRFLMHVLPKGFHRIRHYGLFANANRAENIATARALLNVAPPATAPQEPPDIAADTPRVLPCPCPRCGGRMIVIETFAPGREPRWCPMPS